MRDLYGVELSEGGIAAILRPAGECAKPVAEQIKEQVIAEAGSAPDPRQVSGRMLRHKLYHALNPPSIQSHTLVAKN